VAFTNFVVQKRGKHTSTHTHTHTRTHTKHVFNLRQRAKYSPIKLGMIISEVRTIFAPLK